MHFLIWITIILSISASATDVAAVNFSGIKTLR